jgi:hypothetical protein
MSNPVEVRKYVSYLEEIRVEGGRPLDSPLLRIAVGAVIRNPWAGDSFVDDLWPGINSVAPFMAHELTDRMLRLAGGAEGVVGFGKAVIIGEAGDMEHGAALLHGPYFGPYYRKVVGGTSPISFAEIRGGPGTSVSIPTHHKTENARRDYYQAFEVSVPDAPRRDELVILIGAVSGPRAHARSGDKTTDPKVEFRS